MKYLAFHVYIYLNAYHEYFLCGSAGKEPAWDEGDLGSIPALGRSLEKEKATHSSIQAWRILWGHKESDTTERLSLHFTPLHFTTMNIQEYC